MSMKVLISLMFICCAFAQSFVSNTLGSNMVLQREPERAVIYGYSVASDLITLAINNYKNSVTAGADGYWSITLPAFPAGGPFVIEINSKHYARTEELKNVMFGDVYLCGGQSNMQFTVNAVFNATQALAEADKFPNIRLFTVGQKSSSPKPERQLLTIEQNWSVASNRTLGAGQASFSYFSAVCWFFGLNIAKRDPKLPIGLVSSNWGGTPVEAWSSDDALAKCVDAPKGSGLYNAMIVPFLPMTLSGFLWYQGEANVGNNDYYRCQFPAMIDDWRLKFKQGNLPFLFVQLSPYNTDGPLPQPWSLPDMRLAQEEALKLPNTGMASCIDLGDTGSPFTNIHPRNKQTVGARLELIARAMIYGQVDTVYQGPTYVSSAVETNYPNVSVLVEFLAPSIGSGLEIRSASCPLAPNFCAGWEIGLSDGTWHNATAAIYNNVAVKVSARITKTSNFLTVAAIRYLYADWPLATLYNKEGLPASPFYHVFSH